MKSRKLIGLFAAAVAEPEPVAKKAKATKAAPKATPKAEKPKAEKRKGWFWPIKYG